LQDGLDDEREPLAVDEVSHEQHARAVRAGGLRHWCELPGIHGAVDHVDGVEIATVFGGAVSRSVMARREDLVRAADDASLHEAADCVQRAAALQPSDMCPQRRERYMQLHDVPGCAAWKGVDLVDEPLRAG